MSRISDDKEFERIHGTKPATRYDWSKAPEWAKWAARDEIGCAYWYEKQPHPVSDASFDIDDYGDEAMPMLQNCILDAPCELWRDSLERRPTDDNR